MSRVVEGQRTQGNRAEEPSWGGETSHRDKESSRFSLDSCFRRLMKTWLLRKSLSVAGRLGIMSWNIADEINLAAKPAIGYTGLALTDFIPTVARSVV